MENPHSLVIKVAAGASGKFTMYEDDNVSEDYNQGVCAKTEFQWNWGDKKIFTIAPVQDNAELLPQKRDYCIEFCGCTDAEVIVRRNGIEEQVKVIYTEEKHILTVEIKDVDVKDAIEIVCSQNLQLAENNIEQKVFDFLKQAEIAFALKRELFGMIKERKDTGILLAQLMTVEMDTDLRNSLIELITA